MADYINFANAMYTNYFNVQPSQVKGHANIGTSYYERILFQDVMSCFEIKLPESWSIEWFRFWLFIYGSIAMVYTKKYGWIINPWSYQSLNHQYQPRTILISNAYLDNNYTGVIGVNAELFHCFDDYFGFYDVVTRHATMLADIDKSINVNLFNSSTALYAEARNSKEAAEIKEAYGKLTIGDPLVVVKKNQNSIENQNKDYKTMINEPKKNFITTELIDAKNSIRAQFWQEIGIPSANTDKKERLITSEVDANNVATQTKLDLCLENLKRCFKKASDLSGLEMSIEKRYTDREVGVWDD